MLQILKDTREQIPWDFSFYDDITVTTRKLVTADYSLEGMEDIVLVERKKGVAEIAENIGIDRARFNRELERMSKVRYPFIICEFSIGDVLKFPKGAGIPANKIKTVRITGKFILKTLYEYENKYGITVHFCDGTEAAIQKAVEVFNYAKKMVEE